ncbi:MAG: ankyrin repeat domain-containing protein [Spirochaetes bacterium]|nr:ankyrin repeat domain-containing protein [Spirochaetota bacterium]
MTPSARLTLLLLLVAAPAFALPTAAEWDQAIRTGNSNQVEAWISNAEARQVKNSEGEWPLHLAAMYGQVGILSRLLSFGDDLNAANEAGETALWKAVYWGRNEALEILLPKKPDLALRYERRATILHIAVKRNQIAALRALLKCAPPLEEEDEDGLTPRGWAQKLKNDAAETELRKAGALQTKFGNSD